MRKAILLIIITALLLSGCFDAKEISDYAYVYSIGLDKGVTNRLRMTIQVPSMKSQAAAGSAESGGGGSDVETIVIDCPSFLEGVNMVNTFLSRQVNYMHTKYLVFSESIAREGGMEGYISGFIRIRQLRRQTPVIVTEGTARGFIEANVTTVSSTLSKKQQNMMDQWKSSGLLPDATYGDMINDSKSYYTNPIAILAGVNKNQLDESEGTGKIFRSGGAYYPGELERQGASSTEFIGTAVFNGGKMVEELNGDETRALLMLRGEFQRGYFTIIDTKAPDRSVIMDIRRQKKTQIKVIFNGETPTIDVHVYLEGDLAALQSTVKYEEKNLKKELEAEYAEMIKSNIDKTIEKCQKVNSDVFKFGSVAAMQFATVPEWESYNWLKHFKYAKVHTQVSFVIRRFGTMLGSSEFITSEGKTHKGE